MLPPIDQVALERNPKFKLLYEDIAQNKLNSDASTKDAKGQRLMEEARKDLDIKRTEIAKTQILKSSLDTISARAADLPDELHEVITIVAAQLNGRIPSSEREILQEDVAYFTEHINPISRALSTYLKSIAIQLCRIAAPEHDPSPSLIPDLPTIAQDHIDDLVAATTALAAHRTRLADLAAAVLDAQTHLMQTVVRILEQTVHGSVARAVRAKAEHLAAVAKGLELKLGIVLLTSGPSKELGAALERYGGFLGQEREELVHRREIAEERLRALEGAGGPGREGLMREIARRYARVEEEIKRVEAEVGRLQES
ncbi:hypothetical protein B0J12DRAFT_131385 [Macrophomina phaseolina]|uniref:Uncharacterized protein n=1 Tax=Macrophomina phaseolina TaxID=35725 RepID=A0ABQ8G9G5_9PEZI|nr:hypothetical protein B0J12DRAFT_131385 [Macrophomina phaseolina]